MPDSLWVTFGVSGVETWIWLPPAVAFFISFFTSMVGVSGAFLLLPFQMSVLHFTSPAVSATNLVYNLVAIPGGVSRYIREGRMLWALTLWIVIGTTPGIGIGYIIRVRYLPDPHAFSLFAGGVLSYVAYRILSRLIQRRKSPVRIFNSPDTPRGAAATSAIRARVKLVHLSPMRVSFEFSGTVHAFSTLGMLVLAFVVGIIGGTYGIGGGALMAPFCVSLFRLPVHAIAGAALAATFLGSLAGVLFYQWLPGPSHLAVRPDWMLGMLFGLGGLTGTYLGARTQRHVPQWLLELFLGSLLLLLGLKYIFFGY